MTPDEFRRHGHEAIEWIAEFLENPGRYPVLPRVRPGELTDALPASGPEHGEPMEQILADFERLIVPAMTHWNHPGFLAYFANSATGRGHSRRALHGGAERQRHALEDLARRSPNWSRWRCAGCANGAACREDWFGLIYDTASTTSMHAIAAAREAKDPESRTQRLAAGTGGLHVGAVALVDREGRDRGGHRAGLRAQDRRSTTNFACGPDALRRGDRGGSRGGSAPVLRDRDGRDHVDDERRPRAGDCRHLCERHGLWLHVDAAYAGSAALVPELRWAFEGCERADSFVTNPHKWLLTPMDCSVFYTRRPDVLRRAFSLIPEYLQTAARPARREPDGLRRAAGPPLPRAEAVVRAALVRTRGAGRRDPRARADGAGFRRCRGRRPVLRADGAVAVLGGEFPV